MKQFSYLVLIIFNFLFNSSGLANPKQFDGTQDSNVTQLGTWTSGSCNDVSVVGNYAYILKGSVFEILNITNPTEPIPVGQIFLQSHIHQVLVSGKYAYVMRDYYSQWGDNLYGFYIIDISDPKNPVEIVFYELGQNVCRFIGVKGEYVYAVNQIWSEQDSSSMIIIDVKNPNTPTVIGESPKFQGIAVNISLLSNFAYILTGSYDKKNNRIYKIDITDPYNPSISINFDTGIKWSYQLSVSNNFIYLINYPKLLIYENNSDSLENEPIGSFTFTGNQSVESLYERASYLYVACTQMDTSYFRGLNLHILDINDPSNPFEAGSYHDSLSGYWAEAMCVSGNYAFIALGHDGLNIIDISNISNPSYSGSYHTGGGVGNFSVSENILYVENGQFGGISIIDCEEPENLTMVKFIPTQIEDARIIVTDNSLYMAGIKYIEYIGRSSCFLIFSLSSSTELEEIGSYELDYWAANFRVVDDHAYLILGNGELLILDITDPSNIEEISRTEIFDEGSTIYITDNIAYIGGYEGWSCFGYSIFSRVNIENLSQPVVLDTLFKHGGGIHKIVYSDNYAFIIGGVSDREGMNYRGWVYIFDFANPSEPQILDSLNWNVRDIFIENNVAYLTTEKGLDIYDVSDPYNLKKVGFYYISGAHNVLVNKDIIYVSTLSVLYSFKADFSTSLQNQTELISQFSLFQNYPNPFNPNTTIEFALPKAGFVTLKIYNIIGEEVATLVSEKLAAGKYEYDWSANELASGVYIYRLETNTGFSQSKKLILLK